MPSLTISLPDPILEGANLVITCITSGVGAGAVGLLRNGQGSGVSGVLLQGNSSIRMFDLGTVDRFNSSTMFQCVDTIDIIMSAQVTLDVQCE